jgi:hypothetical protein
MGISDSEGKYLFQREARHHSMHLLPTPPCGLMFVRRVAMMEFGFAFESEKGWEKIQSQASSRPGAGARGRQSRSAIKMRQFNSVQLSGGQ